MNKDALQKKEERWILLEKYKGKESRAYRRDVKRLKDGEPVDYIIGNKPFLSASIDLSFRPLIPREETAFWLKNALEELSQKKHNEPLRVLDIFSGSGCIGIAILKHFPNATVDFADIDKKSIKQIKKNLKENGISKNRSHIFKSNIFEDIPKKKYDIIFSNPPYIPEGNKTSLPRSVIDYEPLGALFGGKDGLFYIKKFLRTISPYIKNGGEVYLEFDSSEKIALERLVETITDFTGTFLRDQYDRWRVVRLIKKK